VRAPAQGIDTKASSRWRRACCIEDVSCDEQSVDGLSFERIKQPVEKDAMLILALDPMENMPKVPVAGVKNAQGHLRVVNLRGTADKEPLGLFASLWLNLFYADQPSVGQHLIHVLGDETFMQTQEKGEGCGVETALREAG